MIGRNKVQAIAVRWAGAASVRTAHTLAVGMHRAHGYSPSGPVVSDLKGERIWNAVWPPYSLLTWSAMRA